jgi:UDP-GlcNAc:undecaprenyl-phosphate GlcNAc-1-phosphate transferase
MFQFMPLLALSFVAAYGFTPITKRLALRWNIVDKPSQRKIHREPIPLLGGVAIYGAFFLTSALFAPEAHWLEFGAVLAGGLWLAIVGYVDDRQGMNPHLKMSAQIIAACVAMLVGIRIQLFGLPILDYGLTLFWIVGIINALNFQDNMDGLAAGLAAIASGAFFVLSASQELVLVASLSAALCGATLGFLRYNFNPASTFMGDVGSMVIGFILAILGIKLDFPAQTPLVTWAIPLLVLAVPIFDTTLVTFTRLREGRSPMQGGKDHSSHRLVKRGLSHRRTVLVLYSVALCFAALALLISQAEQTVAFVAIGGAGLFLVGAFIFLEWSYSKTE